MKKSILVLLCLLLLSLTVSAEEQNPFAKIDDEDLLGLQINLKQELVDRKLLESSLIYSGVYTVGVDIRPGTYLFYLVKAEHSAVIISHYKNVDQYIKASEAGFSTKGILDSGGAELFARKGIPVQLILEDSQVMRISQGICYLELVDKPFWAP